MEEKLNRNPEEGLDKSGDNKWNSVSDVPFAGDRVENVKKARAMAEAEDHYRTRAIEWKKRADRYENGDWHEDYAIRQAKRQEKWAAEAGERAASEYDIVSPMSEEDRRYFESCKSEHMPFVVSNGDEFLPALSESGNIYEDKRKYILKEATELYLEGFDKSIVKEGSFSAGDTVEIRTMKKGDNPLHPVFEDVTARIAEVVPGYNVSVAGENNQSIFRSQEYVDNHFKENQDGTYTNNTLYKGIKNNTGVEISLDGLVAVNDYIKDANLSTERSEGQLILAEYNPDDGGKTVPGTVQVVNQNENNFTQDRQN